MFFQDAPPNTSAYMIAGYTIAFTVMAIYLISLAVRWRNLNQDLEMLESLEKESQPKRAQSKAKAPRRKASSPAKEKKRKKK